MKLFGKTVAALTVTAALLLTGCATQIQNPNKNSANGTDGGLTLDDYKIVDSQFKVVKAKAGEVPSMSSTHIVNVSAGVAMSKAQQALNNYDHALAAKAGYSFDLNTVYQPGRMIQQLLDGRQIYASLLTFRSGAWDQGAFERLQGISPGWIEVDAEDESQPAVVHLTNSAGKPYKIILNYRNVNNDPNYIGRWLGDTAGIGYTTDARLNMQPQDAYIDDPTLEVQDGTHDLFFSATLNQRQFSHWVGDWRVPRVQKIVLLKAESNKKEDVQVFDDPSKVPAWVDRVYSEDVVRNYIQYSFFNIENFGRNSNINRLVLDNNELDVVLNKEGNELFYLGIMTSADQDNTANGIVMIPTRDLGNVMFYPTEDPGNQMATREQAKQVMNAAVSNHPGWYISSLTVQFLYGQWTWEGSYVSNNSFAAQENGDNHGEAINGEMVQAFGLTPADDDMAPSKVVWDVKLQSAFDKYENLVFVKQAAVVGSNSLEEFEGDGTIDTVRTVVDQGQTSVLFTLKEAQFAGVIFRGTIFSSFDRDTLDLMSANVGDHVQFKYGDTKSSPTCFVKSFHDLTSDVSKTGQKK